MTSVLTHKENKLHNSLIVAEFNLKQVETELRRLRKENKKLRSIIAQPEPEPVAWWHDMGDVVDLNVSGHGTPLYTAPPHFLDPAKVARLIDEAFERGKKEVDMEQVKDIAQKLADCALLNSTPPQREWVGLTDEELSPIYAEYKSPRNIYLAIESALREKNT